MPAQPSNLRSPEWDATAYHRLSGPQFAWGQKVLKRLKLRGDELLLDAGCGTGRLTAELLERLPKGRVIAADHSENMLRAASESLGPRFGDLETFVRADLQTLRIEEKVDGLLSTATFQWIKDYPQLYRHLYLAVKPGGWLVAQCGGGPNLSRLLGRASVLMAQRPYVRFFSGWSSPWEYTDDITTAERLWSAGFVDVRTGLEQAPVVLADAKKYREFIASVISREHLAQMPDDELRDKFVDSLTEQAVSETRCSRSATGG